MSSNSEIVYDNRLVRYLQTLLNPWTPAEFAPEDAFTLYHLIQEEGGKSSSGGGPQLPALGHAVSGALASAAAKALVYPVNLCVTRLQVQKQLRNKGEAENAAKDADKEYTSVLDAANKIYKSEGGLKAFYSGCAGDVSKGILDSFLFFLAYNALRKAELKRRGAKQLPVVRDLAVGVLAGSLAKFVSTPIENIVVRQQTAALTAARDLDSSSSSDSTSIRGIAKQIHAERGIAGFWSGYSQSIVLTINPAITFAVDNVLTSLLPKKQQDNPSLQVRFLISALSKAIATTSVYPIMLAKSRAQVSGGLGSDENPDLEPEYLQKSDMESTPQRRQAKDAINKLLYLFQSQYAMLIALRKVYRDEGLAGLYSGIEGEVLKGFLQHGLTMMLKDKVQVSVIELYYVLLKATRRWPEELKKAQENAKNLANEAQERASNVGETVSEGAKNLVDKARGE